MADRTYKSNSAAARALAKGLTILPDTWVMCRDMRHAWSVDEDFHVEPGQVEGRKIQRLRRMLVCMRCETRRIETYAKGRYGLDKIGQYYVYPVGDGGLSYQIQGVPRGVKPQSIVQQEQYRRAMEKIAGAEKGERETADR